MRYQVLTTLLLLASLETESRVTRAIHEASPPKDMQGPAKVAPVRDVKPNHIFSEIIPLLSQKTLVPLRLPEYVPDSDDKETPIFAVLEVAEPERYGIQLAWDKDCTGGNACHIGSIGGSKTPFPSDDRPRVPVTLSKGIKGSFASFDCGAHCDDATIEWIEGGYYYGIDLKAGDKKTLIRMANSAIQSRVKQDH